MSVDLKSPVAQLIGGARGKVLETLARVGRAYSIRQISEMAEVHHTQASELLREFEKIGVVSSQRVGRSIAYEPVDENLLLQSIRRMLFLRQEIVDSLKTYAKDAPPGATVALFGSVVAGRATEGSDLDVLIISEDTETPEDNDWVAEFLDFAQKASGLAANPLRFTRSGWEASEAEGELITRTIEASNILLAGRL